MSAPFIGEAPALPDNEEHMSEHQEHDPDLVPTHTTAATQLDVFEAWRRVDLRA
ncbi:hypothetical protein QTH87_13515 [Variovorax sp. J22P168]|uniref:hypothetical protein n=1 Tax=Variovorax jilinensis TaxID=3053513 RepID=UPI0025763A8F|nr:hypothetical protein [Variovorax sp. J22P168]MDM0013454.1 hypothetical protein [Variovorax sp. J22P168]